MSQRQVEELTRATCFDLLAGELVGRIAFVEDGRPAAVPVNYALAGEKIVFRVEPGSHLRTVLQPAVAFEVDRTDDEDGSGWSVLVRGVAREVEADDVPALLRDMEGQFPKPWAEGVHNVWVAITAQQVTGRRLRGHWVGLVF